MADPRRIKLLDNEDFLEDLRSNRPLRAVAGDWGTNVSTVQKYRTRLRQEEAAGADADLPEDFDQDGKGNLKYQVVADRILPLSWWLQRLADDGFDPDDFTYSIGHSVWTQHTKAQVTKTLYANRFKAALKTEKERAADLAGDTIEAVREAIEGWTPSAPVGRHAASGGGTLVVCASDLQIGKTDLNGGTEDTVRRVLDSFDAAARRAEKERPDEILIVDAGDVLENLWNVPSQRATNDLGLPGQVETAVRVMLEGIKRLAPLAPSLRYLAVPSNHGRSRTGFKQEAGDEHDDYGIAVAGILENVLTLSDNFSHVSVETPDRPLESMSVETSGTIIGVVHGHQVNAPARLETWWAGQALGRGPVAEADILLVGHFHHLNVLTTGDDRHIFVCPSSDPGSAWVTNLKGHQAGAGMLVFSTQHGKYSGLEIL